MSKFTPLDYCQFLLVSQTNYTQTYFGEYSEDSSHDKVNRAMRTWKLSPRELRDFVRPQLVLSENGYILFDDVVLNKKHSFKIETVRRQWSGNEKQIIKGIGVVTCVYVNPDTGQYWVLDYRIFDPERDGKTKLDHVKDMWKTILYTEKIPFRTVLMDSWYASMKIIKMIEKAGKIYYCPLKSNRQVTTSPERKHQRIDSLDWSECDLEEGKMIHVKGFPKGHQMKLFRIEVSTHRTDNVVTNDFDQDSRNDTKEECAIRWKIEQFHREAKQVTGLESCECRKQRAQRNHIACAMLVWVRLNEVSQRIGCTVYQLKEGLLDDYMRQQLKNPSIPMTDA